MTDPFCLLLAEANRYLKNEAAGDQEHPGFRLRVLLLLNVADDKQRQVVAQVIMDAGFWADADQAIVASGRPRVSLQGLARALGAPWPVVAQLLDEFLQSKVAADLGFDHALLFPDEGVVCALH